MDKINILNKRGMLTDEDRKGSAILNAIDDDKDLHHAIIHANDIAKRMHGFKDVEDYWNTQWDDETGEPIEGKEVEEINEALKIVWDCIMTVLSGYAWKTKRKSINHLYPMESIASTIYDSTFNGGPHFTICNLIGKELK